MKKIFILLVLAGCGMSGEDVAEALKECDSDLTMTIHKSTWGESITLTCSFDTAQGEQK